MDILTAVSIRIYIFALCATWVAKVAVKANTGYLVVTPSVFRPNSEEVISVTILEPSEPIRVEAKLFSSDGQEIAEAGHELFGKGTLKLKVPPNTVGKFRLKICGKSSSKQWNGAFTFCNSTSIVVKEKGSSAFIQTDKPIYKPTQTVHINIITTGPDLKPVDEKLSVYITDPRGTRMIHWTDVKQTCCGLVTLTYPLSEQPILGKWSVQLYMQGQQYNRTFDVMKYVLPKFEVAIYPPNYIKDWNSCETVFVKARYTYDKAVNGMLTVKMKVRGVDYYKGYTSGQVWRMLKVRQGLAYFNACISDMVTHPTVDHFRGVLHIEAEVVSEDGAVVKVSDASCPVHKHLVDISFTKDTKRHFKPGLPYKGKLSVYYPDGSPADNVTVRVKSDVNGYEPISQEVISFKGVAKFQIPPMPSVAQSLQLQAKVLRIGDVSAKTDYFSIFMSVRGWYSPSRCHVLVDSTSNNLRVGDEAKFKVHSTCPCNFTMYVEVMSRGNLVHSGMHLGSHLHKRSTHAKPSPGKVAYEYDIEEHYHPNGEKTCSVYIKFHVTKAMTPSSRLLVYYVRPDGEGIADSMIFDVLPQFENRMSIELSKREALPGSDVIMKVNTRPGSCVCIGAVDKSVHQMRPKFQLSPEEIFEELESYDITVADDYFNHVWAWSHGRRRKRAATWWHVKDAQYAFDECGVSVMTDSVRLHFKQGGNTNEGPYHRPGPDHEQTISVPDSITSWVFDGLALSPQYGLALADQVDLKTFKKFFLEFNLPYSVIRGEQVKIPLTVHNYLHSCVKVHLKLDLPRGASIVPRADKSNSVKFCIGMEETKVLSYILVFSKLGPQTVIAEATAYAESRCCAGVLYNEKVSEKDAIGHDQVVVRVRAEAEGIPRHYTHSVYFCPNERIHLSTPNKYEFQYLKKPEKLQGFSFAARAPNDVRIALSALPSDNEDMFEIVIGGRFNTESWIAVDKDGPKLVNASTPDVVSEDEYRPFWVSWYQGGIMVGFGEKIDNETSFLTFDTNRALFIQYIGFSTGWGAHGEFKIWTKRELSSTGYGEVFQLMLPPNVIIGSERAVAKAMGDVMGPSLHNHKRLLNLPHGCGEQNMARFAPNVFVLKYLQQTGQLTNEIREKTVSFLVEGYQRQQSYRRHDGSYSAFGDRDASGNMWLTAFVVACYAQAQSFIYIDQDEIRRSVYWIVSHQRADGSFPSKGRLINKQIQGGIQGKIALTAYVSTTLLEVGDSLEGELQNPALRLAKKFLEANLELVEDPYTTSLVGYALTRLLSERAGHMLKKLNKMAIKRDGLTYWKSNGQSKPDNFLFFNEDPADNKVSSADIEIAAYAILGLTARGDIASSLPIVKWLSLKRNALGGFSSTQDTVVALHALSGYATNVYTGTLDLTVTVESTNMDLQHRFVLNHNNSVIEQAADIPSIPAGLFVSAVGDGCGLLQIDVHYNVPDPYKKPAFSLHVRLGKQRRPQKNKTRPARAVDGLTTVDISNEIISIEPFKVTLEACMQWKHTGSSNMAVLEVSMLTGFKADVESLKKLLDHRHLKLKRYEIEGRKILFYFDEIRSDCLTCVSFEATREFIVGKTHPVPVRIYDYYEPAYEASIFYNASHIGELIQDLCDDKECNEIKEDVQPPELEEECNSIFGCYETNRDVDLCTCYRDCHHTGGQVCASNGETYRTKCHMEMEACHRDVHLEVMPTQYCEVVSDGSGEDSGDVEDMTHSIRNVSLPTITLLPNTEAMSEMFLYDIEETTSPISRGVTEEIHTVVAEKGEITVSHEDHEPNAAVTQPMTGDVSNKNANPESTTENILNITANDSVDAGHTLSWENQTASDYFEDGNATTPFRNESGLYEEDNSIDESTVQPYEDNKESDKYVDTNRPQIFIMMGTQGEESNSSETVQDDYEDKGKDYNKKSILIEKSLTEEEHMNERDHRYHHDDHWHNSRTRKSEEHRTPTLGVGHGTEKERSANNTVIGDMSGPNITQDTTNATKSNSTPKKLYTESRGVSSLPRSANLPGDRKSAILPGALAEEWVKTKDSPQEQKVLLQETEAEKSGSSTNIDFSKSDSSIARIHLQVLVEGNETLDTAAQETKRPAFKQN